MEIYNFKILSIIKEKCFNGYTTIVAECIEDNIIVKIQLKHQESNDRHFVKEMLLEEHKKRLEFINDKCIKEGEIL